MNLDIGELVIGTGTGGLALFFLWQWVRSTRRKKQLYRIPFNRLDSLCKQRKYPNVSSFNRIHQLQLFEEEKWEGSTLLLQWPDIKTIASALNMEADTLLSMLTHN